MPATANGLVGRIARAVWKPAHEAERRETPVLPYAGDDPEPLSGR